MLRKTFGTLCLLVPLSLTISVSGAGAQNSSESASPTMPPAWGDPGNEPSPNSFPANNPVNSVDTQSPFNPGNNQGSGSAQFNYSTNGYAGQSQPDYGRAPNTVSPASESYQGAARPSQFGDQTEYNGQSPYWYYRSGQPYRGYSQPRYSPYIPYPANTQQYGQPQPVQYATAPAGLTIPAVLSTSISTQAAQPGDFVQAAMNYAVHLQGYTYIPGGSTISGEISEAKAGRFFGRSGALSINFTRLTLPNGSSLPIQAHLVGRVGKYDDKNGVYRGEGWGSKIGGFLERSAIGAGGGALLGTAIGAIAAPGYIGTGAWSGAAIGSGIGILDDLMARRGKNVIIHSGTPLQIQLDEPVQIPLADTISGHS